MGWEAVLRRPTTSPLYAFPHVSYFHCACIPAAAGRLSHLGMRSGEGDTRHNLGHYDRRMAPLCCHLQPGLQTIALEDMHSTDARCGGDFPGYASSYNRLTCNYVGHL